MTTVTVTSAAGLEQALASAKAGDIIQLAAGSYTGVFIQNINTAGNITITSADPNNKAMLSDLVVKGSSGLTFSNLELNSDTSKYTGLTSTQIADPYPFRVNDSDRITFTGNDIHGSLDNDPSNDRSGLMFQNSSHITVTNNEFHELCFGIVHSMDNYVDFSNNKFSVIRSDGIHGSSSFATVANNYFTDFRPAAGDHPDAIQFFDENNGTAPHDLLIQNNVYVRGSGTPIEGIFLRLLDTSPLKFNNVQILDNLLIGTTSHGITLLGASNATVQNNSINPFSDYNAWVWIGNSSNVTESNNRAGTFIYGSTTNTNWTATNTNTNITTSNNTTAAVVTDGGDPILAAWLAAHPSFTANHIGEAGSTTAPTTPTNPPTEQVTPPPTPSVTPPPPTNVVLNDGSDTGAKGDDLTKTAMVRIDGQVTEGGAKVTLYSDGALIASGAADSYGKFSLTSNKALGDGAHDITATTTSSGGATSAASEAIKVTVDTLGPQSDLINFDFAKGSGRSGTVSLSGTASDNLAGAVSVGIYRDGNLIDTVSTSDGKWAYDDAKAGQNAHTYATKATDAAGNVTDGAHAVIIGSNGGDNLRGDASDNIIWGSGGYDTMTGGGGNDTFVFRSLADAPMPTFLKNGKLVNIETITDFGSGDHIDFTELGHLSFRGQSTSNPGPYGVTWYSSGGNTYVMADVTGDGRADMQIQLSGYHPLTASDFLLA